METIGTGLLRSVPNLLSLTRLALGLVFFLIPENWRAAAVVLAAVTDAADGAASRRWNAGSFVGQVLDPIADKVFVLAVLATLLYEGLLTPWAAIGVTLRDLTVLAGVAWVLVWGNWRACRRMVPTPLGKVTTVAQFLFIVTLLFYRQPLNGLWLVTTILSGLAAVDMASNSRPADFH